MTLRTATAADLPALQQLSDGAGWNQREEDWRLFLEAPCRIFAACSGDRIVGSSAVMCYGSDLAWIAMILVHPDFRGMGLGGRLTDAAMAASASCTHVGLDATPAGRPLYEKRGFVATHEVLRMECACLPPLDAASFTDKAMMLEDALFKKVLILDKAVFGTSRVGLLATLRHQSPRFARGMVRDGRLAAYHFMRRGRLFRHIGPVVCASDVNRTHSLSAALCGLEGEPVLVDIFADAAGVRAQLEGLGFRVQRPITRMFLLRDGRLPPPGATIGEQLAIAGPDLG